RVSRNTKLMRRALDRTRGGLRGLALVAAVLTLPAVLFTWGCADDDSAPRGEITCDEFCARHIDCESDPDGLCALGCLILQAQCQDLAQELAECLLSRPDSDFECNEDEVTRPKE